MVAFSTDARYGFEMKLRELPLVFFNLPTRTAPLASLLPEAEEGPATRAVQSTLAYFSAHPQNDDGKLFKHSYLAESLDSWKIELAWCFLLFIRIQFYRPSGLCKLIMGTKRGAEQESPTSEHIHQPLLSV